MLLQALTAYADTYLAEEVSDAEFESKPVPWLIEVSSQGMFLGVVPRMTPSKRGKKEVSIPKLLSIPRSPVNRNSGHHPLIGADDIAYVLGAGRWTPSKPAEWEKAQKHHEAFVALIGRAAEKTGDDALGACARFYALPTEVDKARTALGEAKGGAVVALSSGGPLVARPAVRAFWTNHYQRAYAERVAGNLGECLITGEFGLIAPTHEKIKGVSNLGGQASGVALMSFDKEAFQSYGWDQNQNSPVSPGRALAYVLALNALLRSNNALSSRAGRRVDVAGSGFVTWLRDPGEFDALDLFEQADPEQVAELLQFEDGADPQENRVFLLGLSGNGGRLRVRYWLDESLGRVKRNLRGWHAQLRIAYPWEGALPVKRWQLCAAIHRDANPPAHDVLALLKRGVEGSAQPLGHGMLSKVLTRLRHPADNSASQEKSADPRSLSRLRVPMCLIRMCVNDLRCAESKEGEQEMHEGLDPSCKLPAYVCGRLMAEFESLQRVSSESEINNSVLDRYFAMASTYPALAFPKVELLAQKHLRKLRRDKSKAAWAIDSRLQELHGLLPPEPRGGFPGKLSLQEQGLFMLGYYHQKAWSVAQAIERKQKNDRDDANTQED